MNGISSIKNVVAVGIGSALFMVLARFFVIPSPVPNTIISIQYAALALFAVIYGPMTGFLIGFIGHTMMDLSWGGSPCWSWIFASACVGLIIGFSAKKINIQDGDFGLGKEILFAVVNLLAHAVAWGFAAPVLDILIYAEPASKVFAQGVVAGISNVMTGIVVGGLLVLSYSKTIVKTGSLDMEE